MTMTDVPRPPDLYGRRRSDRAYRMLGALVSGYEWFSRHSGYLRRAVTEVDRTLPMVVDRVTAEADGVVSLRLVPADGRPLPRWQPGAHLDVVLPSGRVRQYSLSGDLADRDSYRIGVRRIDDGNGGSREVHDVLREGSRITARGPRNAFPFITTDKYLFIAGGIGITPILPMIRTAAARGADWKFVYTGRSRESMPFLDDIAQLDPDRVWIRPDTEFGVPASGAELLEFAPAGATVYCCGPNPMITGIRIDAAGNDVDAVHWERFSEPPIVDGKPFEVELARSGRVLDVPADRSTLAIIRESVPDVAYSCSQGFCGTCKLRVLSGQVDHRDHVLTEDERTDHMMICVSRADQGRIVVDL